MTIIFTDCDTYMTALKKMSLMFNRIMIEKPCQNVHLARLYLLGLRSG